ncbi:MAG: hypothetical protein ACKOQY_04755 [Bacteroidota bacterium]
MRNDILSSLKPHLVAVGVFLLISLLYFFPVLTGKMLEQHDIAMWLGMSKEIEDFRTLYGHEPLWTSSMFSGMPAYQISVLYPSNLVQYVNKALWFGLPSPANLLFMAMLSFYFLMVALKAELRISIAGAIAFAFCSFHFVSIQAGHNSKVHAIALIPMVFAGILMAYRGRWLFGAALTALGLSLQIYANHLQITYYTAITVGILVLTEAIRAILDKSLLSYVRTSAVLAVAAVLAVLPNITNLLLTYEYGNFSTRSQSELSEKKVSAGLDKDYALGWSYGKLESMTLLIPDFSGGSSMYPLDSRSETYKAISAQGGDASARSFCEKAPVYWGDQPMTSGPVYIGASACFLFVLSFFLLKGTTRIWLVSASALFLMLSWGRHFPILTDFFFDHFPAYTKFRSVAMALVIPCFLIPLGGMMALMRFMDGSIGSAEAQKALKWSFAVTGGLTLIFLLAPGMFCDFEGSSDEQLAQYPWLLDALRSDRESLLRKDALRSLFFIALVFALLWAWTKNKLKMNIVLPLIALFILVDMWGVGKRYLSDKDFTSKAKAEKPFTPTSADQQILQDKSYFRVMNTSVSTFNDASTSYFHRSVGGYHGAKLKRYQELIEYQISNENMNVLNMLNTKYFIVSGQQGQEPMVRTNPGALGPAWIVSDWSVVPNADAEMKAMDSLDTRSKAVIDQRYAAALEGLDKGMDSTASVRLLSENGAYRADKLTYEVNGSKSNLVVFSEIHYPLGWNAYIDNKPATYFRSNWVLRGMVVPSGKHTVEFRFEPETYRKGEQIALAGSILLLLAFGGVSAMSLRKRA